MFNWQLAGQRSKSSYSISEDEKPITNFRLIESGLVNHNGQLHKGDARLFEASHRAFRYGDGLYENIRAFNGKLPFWNYHAARLRRGLKLLSFQLQNFSTDQLRQEIESMLSEIPNAEIRLTVYRSGKGAFEPEQYLPEFLIEMKPIAKDQFELTEDGLTIGLCDTVRVEAGNWLSNLKTLNCLTYVMAGIYRQKHQLDECLLLNQNGHIAEASYSNVFVVKNVVIYTPLLSDGGIDGCMRLVIQDLIMELGLDLEEGHIVPETLLAADEVFLTNSIEGILWAEFFNDKIYTNGVSKFLHKKLNQKYID